MSSSLPLPSKESITHPPIPVSINHPLYGNLCTPLCRVPETVMVPRPVSHRVKMQTGVQRRTAEGTSESEGLRPAARIFSSCPQESVNRLHAQMQAFVSESKRAAELEEKRRYRFLAEKHLLLSNTFLQFLGRVSGAGLGKPRPPESAVRAGSRNLPSPLLSSPE